ncbi:MAG: PDZ domain-containing protein [Spirochaetes bacterium]|jgi:carboxyl-terminal processing protease|nr:PDZ domain-containing protein [Spirochaetota bacterium]
MSEDNDKLHRRERLVWLGVTAALVITLLVVIVPAAAFGQSSSSEQDRLLDMFEQVFRFVQNNYVDEVEAQKLIEGALEGMFDSLDDPHSAYLSMEEMRDLSDTTQGEFGGVGMYISKQSVPEDSREPAYVEVISPIESTPADRAGLRSGDLIIAIEGETTEDLSIDEVVAQLRGSPGSKVEITIRRGESRSFDVSLTRENIEVPTVRHAMIPENIGYIRIIQFTPYTDDRVTESVKEFENEGYESLIIDLRRNPGGLLPAVVDTADLFFSDGLVVGTRGRSPGENQRFTADNGVDVPREMPVVVLIDEGSASASEILAGALKDRDRAYLIGETTYGKGSVQQVRRITTGGFRLTMSRYYTPSGDYIEKKGIEPDLVVKDPELSDEDLDSLARLQEQGLVEEFVSEYPSPTASQISSFIERLREQDITLSERRIRKLVRDEVHQVNDVTQVYDLEFDIVLQRAVDMLREGEIPVQ